MQLTTRADALTKLYIEVTTHCNLSCEMCVQRVWDERIGAMPLQTFARLMDQVAAMPAPPTIHLGGYGEPMMHPDFIEIVQMATSTGAVVEMTTNATMLNAARAQALLELKLDRLVVSVDGVTPDSYSDVRVNGDLHQVIENLRYLHQLKMRQQGRHAKPLFAIAFVAMKSNVHEIPELARLASYIGAWEIKVSNVVPHTRAMEQEILYERALHTAAFRHSKWAVNLSLPRMDINDVTAPTLQTVYDSRVSLDMMGVSLAPRTNNCRFANEGFAAVRADGEVSPCLSLLHTHPEYVHQRQRMVQHHSFGNINDQLLIDIWLSDAYVGFRQLVRDFDFSPCTTCGGCERFPRNVEDCTEHAFPTCGGCLWAQGIIECP